VKICDALAQTADRLLRHHARHVHVALEPPAAVLNKKDAAGPNFLDPRFEAV
jgi:hypothetical protein